LIIAPHVRHPGQFALDHRIEAAAARGSLRRWANVRIGAKGGQHASGAGGRAVWAGVSAAERSRRMRAVVRARWAKRKPE